MKSNFVNETKSMNSSSSSLNGSSYHGTVADKHSFMDIYIPIFLDRFSLYYTRDDSCIEYFLYSKEKEELISTALILSFEQSSESLYLSKFYPEIYREILPRYMSAVCLYLMIHHAASVFGIFHDSFIQLETRCKVFETFYSRLKDFEFVIRYRRPSDNFNVRGIYHVLPVNTAMILSTDSLAKPLSF